ncbi:MAG: hypothetical protein ACI9VR_001764 [Cognaticolwellia sp.]|jgi:uncharacterized protein (DUF924 family)
MQPLDVLSFWYDSTPEQPSQKAQMGWWKKDADFDQGIRERFGATWEQAKSGALNHWSATPKGRLALIIVLDQFSRNLHRGSPLTWAQDPMALEQTLAALDAGEDKLLAMYGRLFLYMPLEHAEDVAMQERSLACFQAMNNEFGGQKNLVDYAEQHAAIVLRFGRFPHRNEVIGRESSAEELAFLKEPGSSF